ncbi:MAG: hypothetical protein DI498_02540 [Paracoccus denitrificans]|nr:MAG: hypothetical protein DI498_02540 [Paracoccus denitrificans]PZO86021.1 MAG: hypothetical protein DI633_02540 [Paracoccus denitrificans]
MSLGVAIYNVAEADPADRPRVAAREGAILGGGVAGGALGGAAAGLICGPGAPICSSIGAVVGGALGAFGMSLFF